MITTSRNKFLGVHITGDVQTSLKTEANKRGISVSKLVFVLLWERLRDLGHEVGAETK